jgi:hypothetical protein
VDQLGEAVTIARAPLRADRLERRGRHIEAGANERDPDRDLKPLLRFGERALLGLLARGARGPQRRERRAVAVVVRMEGLEEAGFHVRDPGGAGMAAGLVLDPGQKEVDVEPVRELGHQRSPAPDSRREAAPGLPAVHRQHNVELRVQPQRKALEERDRRPLVLLR